MACVYVYERLVTDEVTAVIVYVTHRAGSVPVRCLSWMSTVPGTGFEVVTDICVTCVISWKEQKAGLLLTPLFYTTASLFVPPMSMGTGVPETLFFNICAL